MALSNLRNEPRREITEQVVGVLGVGALLVADYALVAWLGVKNPSDFFLIMLIGAMGIPAAFVFIAFGLHAIGEVVCGWLANVGLDPRPTQRYRR